MALFDERNDSFGTQDRRYRHADLARVAVKQNMDEVRVERAGSIEESSVV